MFRFVWRKICALFPFQRSYVLKAALILQKQRILVIKLSAFGDFVQTIPAFQALRNHAPDAHMALLTTPPFIDLARALGIFDEIIPHQRYKIYEIGKSWQFSKDLRKRHFSHIYDFQCTDRTSLYRRLFYPQKPLWIGCTRTGYVYYSRAYLETLQPRKRHALLLNTMGIDYREQSDNGWVANIAKPRFSLPKPPYILLAFGASATRPEKCWSYQNYAQIAQLYQKKKITPVLIGGTAEKAMAKKIMKICPKAFNLVGKTSLTQLALLARDANFALGNDTGAMHFFGQLGVPLLTLFSGDNDPKLYKPFGESDVIQVTDLQGDDLPVKTVAQRLGLI